MTKITKEFLEKFGNNQQNQINQQIQYNQPEDLMMSMFSKAETE